MVLSKQICYDRIRYWMNCQMTPVNLKLSYLDFFKYSPDPVTAWWLRVIFYLFDRKNGVKGKLPDSILAQHQFKKVNSTIDEFCLKKENSNLNNESGYVDYFYKKYQGRVAIGVGYNQNLSEIYPFIFQNTCGIPIGIVAMGVLCGERDVVHIYHIGSFITHQGDGSLMLTELCSKADCFNIKLSVSPVYMPNGKDPHMEFDLLSKWYHRFNFKGEANLMRNPRKQTAEC